MRYNQNRKKRGTHYAQTTHPNLKRRLSVSMRKNVESTKASPQSMAYPNSIFLYCIIMVE